MSLSDFYPWQVASSIATTFVVAREATALVTVMVAVMGLGWLLRCVQCRLDAKRAYERPAKNIGALTVTITADTSQFDAAMRRKRLRKNDLT